MKNKFAISTVVFLQYRIIKKIRFYNFNFINLDKLYTKIKINEIFKYKIKFINILRNF